MHAHPILRVVSALFMVVSCGSSAESQVVTPSQQDLLEMLRSEDGAASVAAVTWISRMGPASVNSELVLALIAELESANALEAETRRQAVALATRMDPESYSFLQRVVAETNDPRTIPVLAQALGSFGLVPFLVDYGELAAPDVLDVVTNPATDHYAVDDGLRILRMMIENQETQPLTAETLVRIRDAAEQRLTGTQYFTTVYYAIDLAGVLDDPNLTRRLELIASYDTEVFALGLENPEHINRAQQRAADRLAGIPALPQHRTLATN